MTRPPPRTQAVLRLFFLSGLSGILFEVLWTRIFTFLLGSSIQSVSAVVTAFMLGLGIGSWLFGRLADRLPDQLLRIYGLLELGVAASGLVAMLAFENLDSAYTAAFRHLSPEAVKWMVFALAFAFITVPATLIGGTLPVLVRYFVQGDELLEKALGRLYAINTLGAAFGAIAMLLLVWSLGYEASYRLALAVNVATGLGALFLGRRSARPSPSPLPSTSPSPTPAPASEHAPAVLACFAISGFSALVYEVVWFRTFDFLLLGKLTTFAIVLATYLLGISLGSLVMTGRTSSGDDLALFAKLEAVVGGLGLLSLPLLAAVTSSGSRSAGITAFFILILATTLVLGSLFPLVGRLASGPIQLAGRAVGNVYSANTLGSVAGSFLAGFVLIPAVGTRATYHLAALLNLAVAAGCAWLARRALGTRWLVGGALACCLALGVAFSNDWLTRYYEHAVLRPGFHFITQVEGSLQSVMVAENAEGDRVLMGGPFQSGETVLTRRQTQQLQAHLPMLLHPDPQRVLEIGYGVGEIARTVELYHPRLLHLAEIDENMIPVANQFFEGLNGRASEQPNVETDIMDGRYFLRMTRERFDVILSDSMILASEGSLRLYTLEHFQTARAHLDPGGMMIVWLPLNVGVAKSLVIAKTFLQAFPQTLLWLPLGHNTQEAYLVGFRDRAALDLAAFEARYGQVAEPALKGSGWDDPLQLLGSFRAGPQELEALTRNLPLMNRDMNPVLDFLPTGDPGEVEELVARLVKNDPAEVLIRSGAATPAALAPLRAPLAALHQADQQFMKGLDLLSDHGDEAPETLLAHRGELTQPLREALDLYPAHHASHVWLALVDNLANKAGGLSPAARKELLEAAVTLDPTDEDAYAGLARLAAESGDPVGKGKNFKLLQTLNPYARLAGP